MSQEDKQPLKSARTEELDNIVLDTIKQNPGVTVKQLELILENDPHGDLSQSFLTNSLRRLENIDKTITKRSQKEFEHGKIVRQYFATDTANDDVDYHIKLDKDVLQANAGFSQGKELRVFALENKLIAISTTDNDYYQKYSLFSEPVNIIEDGRFLKLKFPNKFVNFYNLKAEKYSINYQAPDKNKAIKIEIIDNIRSSRDFRPRKTKRVLIFDDDEDTCKDIVEKLQREGHDVDYATTIQELREKLNEEPYDFISLDKKIFGKNMNDEEDVASKLFFEIKEKSPNTKVGLLSEKLEDSERSYYAGLGFKTVIKKREDKMGNLLTKILSAI